MIKKLKNFWYSPEGTITVAIVALMSILTGMLIAPVTVFTYIGAIIVVTLCGAIILSI